MLKPIDFAVSAVVRRSDDEFFLAVRRPPDDDRLPDLWGLPAITLQEGELPEAGLRRLGVEKLAAELRPIRMLGVRAMDLRDHQLIMMDLEAELVAGEPDVHQAATSGTRYVEQRWTDQLEILVEAAARGSLCTRILLDHYGFPY